MLPFVMVGQECLDLIEACLGAKYPTDHLQNASQPHTDPCLCPSHCSWVASRSALTGSHAEGVLCAELAMDKAQR